MFGTITSSVHLVTVKVFPSYFTLSETFITPLFRLVVICKNQVQNIEKGVLTVTLSNNAIKTVE